MRYENIVTLLQTNRASLFSQLAKELAKSEALPPATRSGDLIEFVRVPSEIIGRYLATGDLSEWRSFVQQTSREALEEQQSTAQRYKAVIELCFGITRDFIERELPGPEYQQERESFYQRMKGLETISMVTAVSTDLKLRSQRRDTNF
jgi:hypothetical protein